MSNQVDQRALRNVMGCYPTGVAVVTLCLPDGRPEGLTINSFTSVSLEPALALFSVNRGSRWSGLLEQTEDLAIHILDAQHADLCRRFATKGGGDWAGVAWHRGRAGVPVLEDCKTSLDCSIHARLDGGDHVIVLARVHAISQHDGHEPLVFYRGQLRSIAPSEAVCA